MSGFGGRGYCSPIVSIILHGGQGVVMRVIAACYPQLPSGAEVLQLLQMLIAISSCATSSTLVTMPHDEVVSQNKETPI